MFTKHAELCFTVMNLRIRPLYSVSTETSIVSPCFCLLAVFKFTGIFKNVHTTTRYYTFPKFRKEYDPTINMHHTTQPPCRPIPVRATAPSHYFYAVLRNLQLTIWKSHNEQTAIDALYNTSCNRRMFHTLHRYKCMQILTVNHSAVDALGWA